MHPIRPQQHPNRPSPPPGDGSAPSFAAGRSSARALRVVLSLVAGLALLLPLVSANSAGATELDGKKLFLREKCNVCHGVSSVGIEATVKSEKMLGPDLAELDEATDAEELLTYLRQKSEIDGKKHKKAFKGSDEELTALVLWLQDQHEAGQAEGDANDGGER